MTAVTRLDPATSAALDLDWTEGEAAAKALGAEWRDLGQATQADIYLTATWCLTWWRHFGPGRRLVCLAARRAGVLVGLLPFVIDTFRVGPVRYRVARLAGTDPHCIVFTLPVATGIMADMLLAALTHLVGPMGCDAVSLTPLSARAEFLPALRGAVAAARLVLTERGAGTHVMFDLAPDFDGYLAGLSRNRRGQFRGDLKALERRYGVASRSVVPSREEFGRFVDFHNGQWQAVGAGGHFVDWPGSTAFYSDIAAQSRPDWGVRLDILDGRDGDAPPEQMAAIFSLVAGKTSHARLPARTLDPEAQKLGIGKVSLMLAIRNAIAGGYTQIEGGRGEYDYKLSLGGKNVPVLRCLITRATPVALWRLRLLLGWSDLLDVLHYKIWFKRIAPRLRKLTGGKPRSLWRLWIRTRI